MTQRLDELWRMVSTRLELELTIPFSLEISADVVLNACFLIKNFGARNGMLIFKDYSEVKPYLHEIQRRGYGFSILDEPSEHEKIDINDYICVLEDWGWFGNQDKKPSWLN